MMMNVLNKRAGRSPDGRVLALYALMTGRGAPARPPLQNK